MKLEIYLKREKITPTEFGRLLGLKSRASVPRYLTGDRIPSNGIMKKIKRITAGEVTANSFYEQR